MPIVIKGIHIRTVVERRIITDEDLSEELLRKIENRVVERLSAQESGQPTARQQGKRKNER